MFQLGFFEENSLHFDCLVPAQQGQNYIEQAPAGASWLLPRKCDDDLQEDSPSHQLYRFLPPDHQSALFQTQFQQTIMKLRSTLLWGN